MAVTAKATIKSWFERGDKPTQAHFVAWLDSYIHKDEDLGVAVLDLLLTGLSTASTADVSALDSIISAIGKLQANKQRTFFKDGSQAMEADIDVNNNKVKQVAAATENGEAVNFQQLNAALDGLKPKDDCRAASVSDDVLHDGEQTIDDVVLVDGDRFLDKDNADLTQRGIWIVRADEWERAADADTGIELQGAFVQVTEGTENANTAWTQYAIDIEIDVTDLYWRQVGSATPDATAATKGKMKLFTDLLNSFTDGSVTQAALVAKFASLTLAVILAQGNDADGEEILNIADPTTDQSADTKAARNAAITTAINALKDGVAAPGDTLNKLYNLILGLDADKLDASAYNQHFKGKFTTLVALNAAFDPEDLEEGDYAQVNEVGAEQVKNYTWDTEDEEWVEGGSGSGAETTDELPEGATNLYFTTARVLAAVLTGLSLATGTAITSTDSILVALGKLQKQITDLTASKANLASPVFTGTPEAPTAPLGTNTTQIATMAAVQQEITNAANIHNAAAKLYLFNAY